MARSDRMKPVVQVVSNRERDAAKALGDCQRMLDEQVQRMEELKTYRLEYISRLQDTSQQGIQVETLRQWHQFLAGLDKAIEQSQLQIERTREICEQRRQEWFQARSKKKAVGRVVERFVEEEQKVEGKREQKTIDEIAVRNLRRRDQDE